MPSCDDALVLLLVAKRLLKSYAICAMSNRVDFSGQSYWLEYRHAHAMLAFIAGLYSAQLVLKVVKAGPPLSPPADPPTDIGPHPPCPDQICLLPMGPQTITSGLETHESWELHVHCTLHCPLTICAGLGPMARSPWSSLSAAGTTHASKICMWLLDLWLERQQMSIGSWVPRHLVQPGPCLDLCPRAPRPCRSPPMPPWYDRASSQPNMHSHALHCTPMHMHSRALLTSGWGTTGPPRHTLLTPPHRRPRMRPSPILEPAASVAAEAFFNTWTKAGERKGAGMPRSSDQRGVWGQQPDRGPPPVAHSCLAAALLL